MTGGSYTTDGVGSPAIYSTADITVNNAELTLTASQGVVVEGKNSVTLNDVTLNASNTEKNGDKSDSYQAVMIYQSMSGDAASGDAAFSMNGGTLTNQNGDVFFVNNTVADINLNNVAITNEDAEGLFLRAQAAGWGQEGSNGGQVALSATSQTIEGDILVDEVSKLNLLLGEDSTYAGAINTDGTAGEVYVELKDGAKWTLTGDSYITSLTCDADSIDLNGFTLYVGDGQMTPPEGAEGQMTPPEGTDGERPAAPPSGTNGERPAAPPSGGMGPGSSSNGNSSSTDASATDSAA